jgi:hypothetical protein
MTYISLMEDFVGAGFKPAQKVFEIEKRCIVSNALKPCLDARRMLGFEGINSIGLVQQIAKLIHALQDAFFGETIHREACRLATG